MLKMAMADASLDKPGTKAHVAASSATPQVDLSRIIISFWGSVCRPGYEDRSRLEAQQCPACFKQFPSDVMLERHLEKAGHTVHEPQCGACHKHCFCFESLREHLLGRLAKKECAAEFSRRGCSLCLNFLESEDALTVHRLQCQFVTASASGKVITSPLEHSRKRIKAFREGSPEALCCMEECQSGVVALDCEMVGGGTDGSINICARVCLVDEHENVLLNTYVHPLLPVTDYRYEITGIKPEDFSNAPSFKRVRAIVKRILGDRKLLVGHDLRHDLACLRLDHPPELIRDTAIYQLFVKTSGVSHKLRFLTEVHLGYKIQEGTTSHDPCEDAVAAMRLYKRIRSQRHAGAVAHNFDVSQLSRLNGGSAKSVYSYSEPTFYCWCLDSTIASVDDQQGEIYGLSTV